MSVMGELYPLAAFKLAWGKTK